METEKKEIDVLKQNILVASKKFIVPANRVIDEEFNSLIEYKKITGISFSTNAPSLLISYVNVEVAREVIFLNNLAEHNTFKIALENRNFDEQFFPTTVKAGGSTVHLKMTIDSNVAVGTIIFLNLKYER